MGSQRVFYFIPQPDSALDFSRVAHSLAQSGLDFDQRAFLFELDERGVAIHALEAEGQTPEEVLRMKSAQASAQFTCRDEHLWLTVSFGSPHQPPVLSIAVPLHLWRSLAQDVRERYEQALVHVADHSGAKSIFIVDDPPDDFYGNMQPIDDQWIVDVKLSDGTDLAATSVLCGTVPGVVLTSGGWSASGRVIEGFAEYEQITAS